MKRYNTIEPGTPVWMIKVSNLKTPKHIVIEKGFVSYADDYQYWIAFSCKKLVSAQEEDLFLTEKDALEHLVIWLKSHLSVYRKKLNKLNKTNEEQKTNE